VRPILPGDLDAAVRSVLRSEVADRPALAADLVRRADLADRFRKRTGRLHPRHGDGSLMAVARLSGPAAAVWRCDVDYCDCLVVVLDALDIRRKSGRAHAGHRGA